MNYQHLRNALNQCIGAHTETLARGVFEALKKGTFEQDYPELAKYKFILSQND